MSMYNILILINTDERGENDVSTLLRVFKTSSKVLFLYEIGILYFSHFSNITKPKSRKVTDL